MSHHAFECTVFPGGPLRKAVGLRTADGCLTNDVVSDLLRDGDGPGRVWRDVLCEDGDRVALYT